MKVRTTMRPDVEIDVDAAEYTDLDRQGLLRPHNEPQEAAQGGSEVPAGSGPPARDSASTTKEK